MFTGVPIYAFIVGGIVGVIIITCITVGVIRLRYGWSYLHAIKKHESPTRFTCIAISCLQGSQCMLLLLEEW